MSRFDGDGGENFPGEWWLWENALKRSFNSRRGQLMLRELRDALLALPEQKLIYSRLADATGGVCAMGALALHHRVKAGEEREAVLYDLHESEPGDDDYIETWEIEQTTLTVAEHVGMAKTMAVDVAWHNDREHDETPEERYTRILAWLDNVILDEVPA